MNPDLPGTEVLDNPYQYTEYQVRVHARRAGQHVRRGRLGERMAGRGNGPDFVEALARGLDILAAFGAEHRSMSLSEVAAAAGLTRPPPAACCSPWRSWASSVRVRDLRADPEGNEPGDGLHQLAGPVGYRQAAHGSAGGPHRRVVVHGPARRLRHRLRGPRLGAQADRAAVEIGTHFPAAQTSQGKVLLAALPPDQVAAVLVQPSRSGLPPYIGHPADQLRDELAEVRAGAGRWPTRSSRPASVRWPSRSGTEPGRSGPR
jgi:Transcriptional regulator